MLGTDPARGMSWRGYAKAFALSNLLVGAIVWVLFMVQAWLPLNPDAIPNMRWDLALHTMVSFLTNTNQQHYSGQAQLSYLSQMVGIVGLQVVTPMMGLAMVVATLRALFGGREEMNRIDATAAKTIHREGIDRDVGNYFADVIRRPSASCCRCAWCGRCCDRAGRSLHAWCRPNRCPVDASAELKAQKIPLGRSRRWSRPSSSAPTAAAGTARTVRLRWRTRRHSRTCSKCLASC